MRRALPPLLVFALLAWWMWGATPSGPPRDATLIVYRGSPTPTGNVADWKAALGPAGLIEIANQDFEARPLALADDALSVIRAALQRPDAYEWYNRFKRCYFHADYAVQWGHTTALLCFGCGELRLVQLGVVRRYQMSGEVRGRLQGPLPRR